ncbi:hypothetical protein BCE_2756 [Bacillus cereus ATCC 10987]|uniref:Uncharacterized protein n=1 Tax=Bacillus cereus (strain ATCC 10987 / NRS 248) TaxID=222523 RepID=Q736Z4_BACC1|nr:hypothetical protein BCE_2756 [Bacillus cereus ATCC 10987]
MLRYFVVSFLTKFEKELVGYSTGSFCYDQLPIY